MQTIHELCNKLLLSQSESFRNQKSKIFFPNNCSFKASKGTLLHAQSCLTRRKHITANMTESINIYSQLIRACDACGCVYVYECVWLKLVFTLPR